MPIAVYPALVTGDQARGYHADLVDFPGATVTEANWAELLKAARERLMLQLASLEREGREWPAGTPVEALGQRLQQDGAVLLLVDVQVDDTPVRVNISMGERLLRRLDEAAEAQSMTRSGFIAAAVLNRLGEDRGARGEEAGSQRLFEEVADVGRRVTDALGPDSAFGRAVAELDARAVEGLRALADNVASAVKRRPGRSGPHDENGA